MGLGTCTFSLLIGRRASHKDRKAHFFYFEVSALAVI